MNSKDSKTTGIEPGKQLELLQLQCNSLTPQIYRTYALYLQILRSILLNSVRNAILSLITDQTNTFKDSTTLEKSKSCQLIVDKLVHRCNSLLTVEHIIDLSKQIEAENEILLENARQQMASVIEKEGDKRNYASSNIQSGDIDLDYYPPIENPSQIDSWFISASHEQNEDINLNEFNSETDTESNYEVANSIGYSFKNNFNESKDQAAEGEKTKLDLFKSLFSIANKAFEANTFKDDSNKGQLGELRNNPSNEINMNNIAKDYLPDTPQALAEWINAFEIALSRRLRNLSHALNVELLRVGIVNSIVPVGILDAVLAGQMQSEYSESNLLRICVPTGSSSIGDGIDITCLLVHLSDLEFDTPELRNCRSQLKKYQKQLLKMVRQQRHWQSRSLVDDLKRNWWKKPPETSPTNSSKN